MTTLLIEETLRLYRRYQLEIVEALNLCPWAKRARLDGRVREVVSLITTPDPSAVLEHIDRWNAEPPEGASQGTDGMTDGIEVEIGLVLLPLLEVSRGELERFATTVMAADAARHHLTSPEFAIAAFHPEAPLLLDSAERLIPFLRRTPDPTLQLVRISSLERVRQGEVSGTRFVDTRTLDLASLLAAPSEQGPHLRERVARANLETLHDQGIENFLALFEDIQRDRRESRRRPGVMPDALG